jgi:hypothetical protein
MPARRTVRSSSLHVTFEPAPQHCTKCWASMVMARIEPAKSGFDLRTFECTKCNNVDQYLSNSEQPPLGHSTFDPRCDARRRTGLMKEYRGVEYAVVQGIERGVWKWTASVEGVVVTGNAQTRPAAVIAAEKAIDRALVGRTGPPLQPD